MERGFSDTTVALLAILVRKMLLKEAKSVLKIVTLAKKHSMRCGKSDLHDSNLVARFGMSRKTQIYRSIEYMEALLDLDLKAVINLPLFAYT